MYGSVNRLLVASAIALSVNACAVDADVGGAVTGSLRQQDFGQRRSLVGVTNDWRGDLWVPQDHGVTWPRDSLRAISRSPDFKTLRELFWVGDESSYVDVFNVPIRDRNKSLTFADRGVAMRFYYAYDTQDDGGSPPVEHIDLDDPRLVGDIEYEGPWQALRFYDRGECSQRVDWGTIARALADELDAGFAAEGLYPSRSPNAIPYLRAPMNNDTFVFETAYSPEEDPSRVNSGTCQIFLSFEGRFAIHSSEMYFELVEGPKLSQRNCGSDAILEEPREELQRRLEPEITEGVRNALAQPVPHPEYPSPYPCELAADADAAAESDAYCAELLTEVLVSGHGYEGLGDLLQPSYFRCVEDSDPETEDGGACAMLPPLVRLHETPWELEIVVVDDRTDADGHPNPWYHFIDEATSAPFTGSSMCDRAPPAFVGHRHGFPFGRLTFARTP